MAKKTTLKDFESVYPRLEETILDHAKSYKLPQKELDWLKQVMRPAPARHVRVRWTMPTDLS